MALRRGVGEHVRLHGRGEDERRGGGERRRGQEVVAQAERQAGKGVGGSRRDDEHVGLTTERDVADLGLGQQAEQVGVRGPVRDGLEREGPHELGRLAREDHVDDGFSLRQRAGQGDGLVGGDAAGDAEHDAGPGQGRVMSDE